MPDTLNAILKEVQSLRKEIAEIKAEIKKDRIDSEYCSKKETMEILGWSITPKAGSDKLGMLRKHGLLTRPSHSPFMYITEEVYKLKKQIESGKVIVQRVHTGYKITKQ